MEQREIDETNCKLRQHVIAASEQTNRTATFAALLLATLDYFRNPAGKLQLPDREELAMISDFYRPGMIDAAAIRSQCQSCSLQAPCKIARALQICEGLCGDSGPEAA